MLVIGIVDSFRELERLPLRRWSAAGRVPGVAARSTATVPPLEAAEGRWRAVNGLHLVALVRAGARFEKGWLVERPKGAPDEQIDEVVA